LGKRELAELSELLVKKNDNLISEKEELEKQLNVVKKEKDMLEAANSQLEAQLDEMQKLIDKNEGGEVSWDEVGSLAEYSVQINQLLEATQKTADYYLANIKQKNDQMMEEARLKEERVQKASAAILMTLQQEVDRLLVDFKSGYEQLYGYDKNDECGRRRKYQAEKRKLQSGQNDPGGASAEG